VGGMCVYACDLTHKSLYHILLVQRWLSLKGGDMISEGVASCWRQANELHGQDPTPVKDRIRSAMLIKHELFNWIAVSRRRWTHLSGTAVVSALAEAGPPEAQEAQEQQRRHRAGPAETSPPHLQTFKPIIFARA
jgi:hypothetical protein